MGARFKPHAHPYLETYASAWQPKNKFSEFLKQERRLMQIELTPTERSFAANFIRDFSAPYQTQQPTGTRTNWRTKHRRLSDPPIRAHLEQRYWLGTKAAWYPVFYNLDVDHPTSDTTRRIFDRLDRHGIGESQRALMTSPSYRQHGNFRIYLRLEYHEKTPTHRLGYKALSRAFGDLCEIYPQKRRKDRLPCGHKQDLINEETGQVLDRLTWEQEFHFLLKLDPTAIENLPHQPTLFEPPLEASDAAHTWKPRGDAANLIQHGLQQHGTRSEAQYEILNFIWRSNWQPDDAAAFVKHWIRTRHNGYSKTAAQGNWREINAHIDRQVAWLWERPLLPDTPHGLGAALTRDDLVFAAKTFYGDPVRQKQLAALCAYYRPRSRHDWVFVPAHVWREQIASNRTYLNFINEIEQKGLLKANKQYRVGEHSRSYQLALPATSEPPLQHDDRHIDNFYEALDAACTSRREIAELTGIHERTMRRYFSDRTKRTSYITVI